MKPASLIRIAAELTADFRARGIPADRCSAEFFRSRRYLGAKDRRVIGDLFYHLLRHLRRIDEAMLDTLRGSPADPSALVTARHAGFPITEMAEHWRGNSSPCEKNAPFPCDIARMILAGSEGGLIENTAAFVQAPEILGPLQEWLTPLNPTQALLSAKGIALESAPMNDGGDHPTARRCSLPDWLWIEMLRGRTEMESLSLARALLGQAPVTLRVNTLRCTLKDAMAVLTKEGIAFEQAAKAPDALHLSKRIAPENLPGFNDGWFEFQDEASQLASIFAAPRPGELVIDACAGSGGKALHMAALMRNRGRIIAFDSNPARLKPIEERRRRATATIIEPGNLDAQGNPPERLTADLIFIDAPCSGTGTLRRSPEIKWRLTPGHLDELNRIQTGLLERWSQCLKPGGRIVYATCSVLQRENERIVDGWIGNRIAPDAAPIKRTALRLTPDRDGCDGFTAESLVIPHTQL